jgi:hypothetical protein
MAYRQSLRSGRASGLLATEARPVYTPLAPPGGWAIIPPVFRFLLLAILATALLLGLGALAFDAADGGDFGLKVDGRYVLGGWLLEAMTLTALFLLVQGRGGAWWLDGLLTAWMAWIFRGPVLVLAVTQVLGRGPEPWWGLSLRWLALYSASGLLLGFLARRLEVRR